MKRSISILVLYPDHLNLNGDAANAGVLARRANWHGIDASIDFFYPGDPLPVQMPDFVILGHGSESAWDALDVELARIRPTLLGWFEKGVFGLAVNSGQELLHSADWNVFQNRLVAGDRISNFAVTDASCLVEGKRVLGYQNSVFDAPLIEVAQNFVATQLHGPVLAKNAWLADWFITQIAGLDAIRDAGASHQLEFVADLEVKVWELEEPLASE